MTLSSLDYLDLPMSLIISLMLATKLQKSIGELIHFKKCNIINSFYASICKELQSFKDSFDIALAYSEEQRSFKNTCIY